MKAKVYLNHKSL